MRKVQLVSILFVFLLLMGGLTLSASATGSNTMYDEIEIPNDFEFSISSTCSGHDYFHQATARSDGMFLICAHHIDSGVPTNATYYRQYIDLYNSDGTLTKEISFYTKQDYVAELTETHITLYFYDYKITIDLLTNEIQCFDTPDIYVANNDAYDHLRLSKFESGEWQYFCKKDITGYSKLTRQNGDVRQAVVEMTGTGRNFMLSLVSALILGVLIVVAIAVFSKKKRKWNNGRTGE